MPAQRPRHTTIVSLLTSVLLIAGLVLAAPADAGTAADEQLFVQLINQTRAGAGLAPLTVHSELRGQARSWASSMASTDQLAHAPDISRGISAPWTVLGENVGVHGIQDVQQLYAAFVASPSHYANIVDPRYTAVGVGVVVTDEGELWTTHRFMATAEAQTTTTAPPTTAPTTAQTTTAPQATTPPTTRTPTTRSTPTTATATDPTTATTAAAPSSTSTSTPKRADARADTTATTRPSPIAEAEPDEQAPAAIADGTSDGGAPSAIEPVMVGPGRPDVDTVEQMLIDLIEAGI